jgi:3-methyladenine DNA glycosylase/8-oxoguanine DNA glycosylase
VRRIADRATALQRAATMEPALGRAHLEKLPGIGPWTSGVVMGGPLGDPDAVPLGDYNLANWVAYNLAGEERADDQRMMALLAPYAGQNGLVARLVKGGGCKAPPRRGPRMSVMDIRKM